MCSKQLLAPFVSGLKAAGSDAVNIDISVQSQLNSHSDARLGEHFIISYFPDGEFKLTLKNQDLVKGLPVTLSAALNERKDLVKIFLALGTLKDAGAGRIKLVLDVSSVPDNSELKRMISSPGCLSSITGLFGDLGADVCFIRSADTIDELLITDALRERLGMPVSNRARVADVDSLVFFEKDRDFAEGIASSLNSGIKTVSINSIVDFLDSVPELPADVLIVVRPQKPNDVFDLLLLSRALALRGCRVKIYSGAIAMARQHKSWIPKFHTYADVSLGLDSPEPALESASLKFILENLECRWLIGHNLHFVKAGMVDVYNISSNTSVPGIIDINAFPDLLGETVRRIREEYPDRKIIVLGADKGVSSDMVDASSALEAMGVETVGYLNKHRVSSTQVQYDGNMYSVDGSLIKPEELSGAVVILADDEIASGGTISEAAVLIDRLAKGDVRTYMSVVLGRFSGNCWERIRSVQSVKGVFVSDLYALEEQPQGQDKVGDGGLLRTIAFAGRFMDNMQLFAGMQRRSVRWAEQNLDDGIEFAEKYPYILKAFVNAILNKRFLRRDDMRTLGGLAGLLENMPKTSENMTLAALIDLKMKLAHQIRHNPEIFKRIRAQYSKQGQKHQLMTQLGSLVYTLLATEVPGVYFADSDIIAVAETVVSIVKENNKTNEMNLETAVELVLDSKDILSSTLSGHNASLIAEHVLWVLFTYEKNHFAYLYEVHGDEAYSEDMSEVMKVSDDNEFARVLFINIARMLHIRYSVIFSERLRFMLSQALKIIDPDFNDLKKPLSTDAYAEHTIRDMLVSTFLKSRPALYRNYSIEASA